MHDDIPDQYKHMEPVLASEKWLDQQETIGRLKHLQKRLHTTSKEKGWWEDHGQLCKAVAMLDNSHDLEGSALGNGFADLMFKMSRTMLVVTELSEAIEALRQGDPPDDKVPEYRGFAVELADAVIRILDIAEQFDLPVIDAIFAKADFNDNRTYKHGGKAI